jgi:hypothetical protein
LNRTIVLAAGDLKVPIACFAEPILQEGEGLTSQISACLNAKRVHLGRRLRAYAMELCDRKRRHEGLSFVRQDRELAIWLAIVRCDLREAMNLHLAEIATQVAPHAHAAILLDQAGWSLSGVLQIPSNITRIPLPAKCPELNPQENIWQFIRDNWLSNRIFKSYADIVDHCCRAWNNLIDQPWRIMSIGTRPLGLPVLITESWY